MAVAPLDRNVFICLLLSVDNFQEIRLHFNSFDVEKHANCLYDYLRIYSGNSTSGTRLASECGNSIPQDITYAGEQVYLQSVPRHVVLESLQWRHNWRDGVSNHQPHDFWLNSLFRRIPKKTSKLRIIGICAGNSHVTGEFPAQRASNAEKVSIWWRQHDLCGFIARTHGCVRNDSETHETVLLDCTTGEAGSAIQ